jgi:hypothetical protein
MEPSKVSTTPTPESALESSSSVDGRPSPERVTSPSVPASSRSPDSAATLPRSSSPALEAPDNRSTHAINQLAAKGGRTKASGMGLCDSSSSSRLSGGATRSDQASPSVPTIADLNRLLKIVHASNIVLSLAPHPAYAVCKRLLEGHPLPFLMLFAVLAFTLVCARCFNNYFYRSKQRIPNAALRSLPRVRRPMMRSSFDKRCSWPAKRLQASGRCRYSPPTLVGPLPLIFSFFCRAHECFSAFTCSSCS